MLERQPLSDLSVYGALHATDHTTPYLSILARTDLTRWEDFADLYYDHHAYSRLRCMRGTIHLIPEAEVEMVQCVYRLREDAPFPEFEEYGISMEDATRLRFAIMEVLEQEGSQSSTSIKHYISPKLINKHVNKYGGETTTVGPVLRWLWALGLVESGIGVKDWRHKDNHFRIALAAPAACDVGQADLDLARWYFSLYGPATFEDWAWWSGLSAERSRRAFSMLKEALVEVRVEGMKESLCLLQKDMPQLQQTEDSPPDMVRLLPYEDALLKAYRATRYRFYDEDGLTEDIAFTRHGEARPTLWADGRIIGIWSWIKKSNEPMTIEPYLQLTRHLRKRLKNEIEAVRKFIDTQHVIWNS